MNIVREKIYRRLWWKFFYCAHKNKKDIRKMTQMVEILSALFLRQWCK